MKIKHCPKCNKDKKISEFSKNRSAYDNLSSWCKICNSEYQKEYYSLYADKNRKKLKKYHSEYSKNHYIKNKEKINKHKVKYQVEKYNNNTVFKLTRILRSRLNQTIFRKKDINLFLDLLGCTVQELKQHLESQFEPGMSWDNYGLHGWHIDHIKPCAKFDLSKESEQHKCFHYTNLQPLWAEENWSKGSTYIDKTIVVLK